MRKDRLDTMQSGKKRDIKINKNPDEPTSTLHLKVDTKKILEVPADLKSK